MLFSCSNVSSDAIEPKRIYNSLSRVKLFIFWSREDQMQFYLNRNWAIFLSLVLILSSKADANLDVISD